MTDKTHRLSIKIQSQLIKIYSEGMIRYLQISPKDKTEIQDRMKK